MLKKTIMQLLCWGSLSAFAQISKEMSSFKAEADVVLKGINQYPVTTGILYNRVFPVSGLGQHTENIPDKWNAGGFAQAVHELEEAMLIKPSNPVAKSLATEYRKASLSGDMHILSFNTTVEELDTIKIKDSTIFVGNRTINFDPKPGSSSPFIKTGLSAAAIMNYEALATGKQYRFFYPKNIPLGFESKNPISARIRFGQGQWENLQPNTPLLKTFGSKGELSTRIEIVWEGGETTTFDNQLEITSTDPCSNSDAFLRPDECPDWYSNPKYAPSWPSNAIQASIGFNGINGKGEVYHYMHNGNTSNSQSPVYKNPIIFVDGIDFGDKRKGQVIYGKYLSYLPEIGAPSSVNLGSNLRNDGKDILILNFPDGTIQENVAAGKANQGIDGGSDYIERNAMVLVKLIQQVNQNLQPGSSKITIIGPSMGGLIAKYALAYMEKNAASTGNHNCGLFISQDSPHMGANIPIGLQQLLKNLAGINIQDAEIFWDNLNTPAACELLIDHENRSELNVAHEIRNSYLQNTISNSLPGSFGWPIHPELRKVALSNGNLNGIGVMGKLNPNVPISGGAEMVNFRLSVRKTGTMVVAMAVFGGGFLLPPALLLKSLNLTWKGYYAPQANATSKTLEVKLGLTALNEDIDIFSNTKEHKAFDSGVSLDGAPGGVSNSTQQLTDVLYKGLNVAGDWVRLDVFHGDKFHSFIPVKSALAFHWNTNGIQNLGENLSNRNLVCTGEIPFDAFYSSPYNDAHIHLTEAAVKFLQSQFNYTPPPGGTSYPATIVGPKAVAAGSNTKFTAEYQGNLQFRTSWNISQSSGVIAQLTNPFSQSCNVLVSSGTGQDYGFYVVTVTTEVRALTGEWICAGKKSQKVNVRKIAFMGMITSHCLGNLKQGCSYFVYSGTPVYGNLTNGVSHKGYEWQISKFSNSDFSSSCWGGALTITNVSHWDPTVQKAMISLVSASMSGNVFIYYARVRNIMTIPNPDFGQPGEPETLEIEGVWKMAQLETEVINGPNCPPCNGIITVEPPIARFGNDHAVNITPPSEFSLPARLKLYDEKDMLISDVKVLTQPMNIELKNLEIGHYKIVLESEDETYKAGFWLTSNMDQMILTSPQILKIDQEKEVRIRIVDPKFLENGMGCYEATMNNLRTNESSNWTGYLEEFSIPANELTEGEYEISLKNSAEESLIGQFMVLPKELKPVSIKPNPAGNQVEVHIPGLNPWANGTRLKVRDLFGQVLIDQEIQGETVSLDLSELTTNLYLLQVNDGNGIQNIWFRKE